MNVIEDVHGQIRGDIRNEQMLRGSMHNEQMLRGSLTVPQNIKHDNYEELKNLPQINGNTVIGNKTSEELGLQDDMDEYTNLDIIRIWNSIA